MLRGLGIAAGIFVLFFAFGFGLLQWRTHEPDFLAQKVKDRVSQSVSSAPAVVSSSPSGASDPEALDAPTSTPPSTGALDKASSGGDANTQLETYRVEARDSLQIWYSAVMAGGLLSAMVWLTFAWTRASSQTVHGAGGMRSASPFWWGCLLLLIVLGIVAALYALRSRALGDLVSSATVNGMVLFCALWAMLAYYLGCAFGAPTVLRASVPLATRVVPVRGAPR
jgi:hypothetical protein